MINVPNHRGTWCSLEDIIGSLVVIVLRKGLLIPLGTNTNMLAIIIFAFILSVSSLQFVVSHFDDQLIFRVLVMFLFLLNQYPASGLRPQNFERWENYHLIGICTV